MATAFAFPVLSINLDQMAAVVNALPFAAHMRSLGSDQYVLSNLHHAKQLGFECPQDIMHLAYSRIAHHRRQCIDALGGNLELEQNYQHFIRLANTQTELVKEPRCFQTCTLFPTGFIHVNSVKKIPILDSNRRVYTILTLSQDITNRFDLIDLYSHYKKHYHEVKDATEQFLKYLDIVHYFKLFPTQQELMTLLMFKNDAKAKYAARQLGLSDRTVEEYKARLRNKISQRVTLEQILLKLRTRANKLYKQMPFMDIS